MRIVYAGNNRRGIACLEALAASRHEVVHAVAQRGEREGWYKSIEGAARKLNIPVSVGENPNSTEFLDRLRAVSPDLVVMCGYSKIVGEDFRGIPRYGCINLHASALPFYRGAAPLNWALINGENEIGLSIYQVDGGIDTGPIIAQARFEVGLKETIRDVSEKVLAIYPQMLLQGCDDLERGGVDPTPQNLNDGSYYTKRRPEDGRIKWGSMTGADVHNLVRALTDPYPCAFFFRGDGSEKIEVVEADVERKNYFGVPGRVATTDEEGIIVIARDRGVRLRKMRTAVESGHRMGVLQFRTGEDLS